MKKLLVTLLILLLSTSCITQKSTQNNCAKPYVSTLTVGSQNLCVQIVNTAQEMQKGLSDRASLESNQGMLFGISKQPAFWMKDMKFNLDMIWIKDGRIIAITKNIPAPQNEDENRDDKLPTYSPPLPIDHVLEVNSGWSEKNNIQAGDEVQLNF